MATIVINSGTGGDVNPGFDGSGGPVATSIAIARKTDINFSGGEVLNAQTSYGWDQFAGEARIVCPAPSGSIGDSVALTFGCTPGNLVQRFAGTIVETDTTLAPHAVMLLCKGPLYACETFKNDVESLDIDQTRPGLAFGDLVGAQTGTLQQIVAAVLSLVGVSYSLSNFDNPSHVYGTGAGASGLDGAFDAMTWGTHETAAAYIHRFLQASAGYRLFDSADGNVYLKQASMIPSGSVDFTLTLGQDIFGDTHSVTSSIGAQTAVIVQGFDDGSGPATSGVVGSGQSAFQLNSPLIETDAFAAELAAFWLTQVNRNQELIRLNTPRDELYGPVQTHAISGVTPDTMRVKSVTTDIAANGEFTQHLVYVAAG